MDLSIWILITGKKEKQHRASFPCSPRARPYLSLVSHAAFTQIARIAAPVNTRRDRGGLFDAYNCIVLYSESRIKLAGSKRRRQLGRFVFGKGRRGLREGEGGVTDQSHASF